jgi:hypothetical protein
VPLRAFRTRLVAGLALTLAVGVGASPVAAAGSVRPASPPAVAEPVAAATPDDTPPITVNPFLPDDRGISECISAVPKPGCGSEERGGWHQQLVFLALVGGLAFIGWRIVAGARRNSRANAARLQTATGTAAPVEPSPVDGPPPPATLTG